MTTPVNDQGFTSAQAGIVTLLKTFSNDTFTHDNADACIVACEEIAKAFNEGVDPNEPVRRAGLEHLTTVGLVANRISNLAFRPGDAVDEAARGQNDFSYLGPAQISICKKFRTGLQTVVDAAIAASGKLELAPPDQGPSELARVSYLVDTDNTAALQRAIAFAVELDVEAVEQMSLKALASALCDPTDRAFARAFKSLMQTVAPADVPKILPVQKMMRSAAPADINTALGLLKDHSASPVSRAMIDLGFRNALLRNAQPDVLTAFLPHVTDVTGISLGLRPNERTNLLALLEQRRSDPAKFLIASTPDALDLNEAVTFENVAGAKSVLALACACQDLELVDGLIERGAHFASPEDFALATVHLAFAGNLEGLALLKDKVPGFDVDAMADAPVQTTLLVAAALSDHPEVIAQLLAWGATPDVRVVKDTILIGSSQKQHLEVNFVQEAARADSALALDAAAESLGMDLVCELLGPKGLDEIERINPLGKRCLALARAWQAGSAVGALAEQNMAEKAAALGLSAAAP